MITWFIARAWPRTIVRSLRKAWCCWLRWKEAGGSRKTCPLHLEILSSRTVRRQMLMCMLHRPIRNCNWMCRWNCARCGVCFLDNCSWWRHAWIRPFWNCKDKIIKKSYVLWEKAGVSFQKTLKISITKIKILLLKCFCHEL